MFGIKLSLESAETAGAFIELMQTPIEELSSNFNSEILLNYRKFLESIEETYADLEIEYGSQSGVNPKVNLSHEQVKQTLETLRKHG